MKIKINVFGVLNKFGAVGNVAPALQVVSYLKNNFDSICNISHVIVQNVQGKSWEDILGEYFQYMDEADIVVIVDDERNPIGTIATKCMLAYALHTKELRLPNVIMVRPTMKIEDEFLLFNHAINAILMNKDKQSSEET